MPTLNDVIQAAAARFASEVLSALRGARVNDLFGLANGGTSKLRTAAAPKVAASARPAKLAVAPAPRQEKRSWLKCSAPSCKNKYFPTSGRKYLCYEHFLKAGGKHPSVGKKRK